MVVKTCRRYSALSLVECVGGGHGRGGGSLAGSIEVELEVQVEIAALEKRGAGHERRWSTAGGRGSGSGLIWLMVMFGDGVDGNLGRDWRQKRRGLWLLESLEEADKPQPALDRPEAAAPKVGKAAGMCTRILVWARAAPCQGTCRGGRDTVLHRLAL